MFLLDTAKCKGDPNSGKERQQVKATTSNKNEDKTISTEITGCMSHICKAHAGGTSQELSVKDEVCRIGEKSCHGFPPSNKIHA
jgi:hypothetical protein